MALAGRKLCVSLHFKTCLFICKAKQEGERDRWVERIFHPLVHFLLSLAAAGHGSGGSQELPVELLTATAAAPGGLWCPLEVQAGA